MKRQIAYCLVLLSVYGPWSLSGQGPGYVTDSLSVSKLFSNNENLPVKLSLSIKEIKKETNDSTFILSSISYLDPDGSWRDLKTDMRARGNYRRNNCYFPPLKLKIDKSVRKGTLFEEDKKLKLVLPCQSLKSADDYVVKEYLAYRLYENISPYHFKTRLLDVTFEELRGDRTKSHELKGIFIEDIEQVAERHEGRVFERPMHPMNQGALTSVRNAFFQFMIGNTDYSTSAQHNEKLIYVNKEIIPVPYDFDMSGLVNTNYSVVSVINGEQLPISSVEERLYRGFERDPKIIYQVRREFLDDQDKFLATIESLENAFDDPRSYKEAYEYIADFFEILADDKKFDQAIMKKLRTK